MNQKKKFNPDDILDVLPEVLTKLTLVEQKIALNTYRLISDGNPATIAAIAQAADEPVDIVAQKLDEWPAVYKDKEGAVVGFWGIALTKMHHKLKLEDNEVYTWCAWDALFIPELLGKSAVINSSCPVTKEPIKIHITPEGIGTHEPENIYVSFLEPDVAEMMDDPIANFCHYVHFFSSKGSGEQWISEHEGTYLLSLDEVLQLSQKKNAAQFRDTLHMVDAKS